MIPVRMVYVLRRTLSAVESIIWLSGPQARGDAGQRAGIIAEMGGRVNLGTIAGRRDGFDAQLQRGSFEPEDLAASDLGGGFAHAYRKGK